MQPVSRLPPARVVGATTTCLARATATRALPRRVAPAPRLRVRCRAMSCGGEATEPVVEAEEEGGLAAEELEVLEAAAIAGVDEGRRPTDYDRRAHIFEESSRVFRDLKHRRDGDVVDGENGSRHRGGGVTAGATEAETGTRQHNSSSNLGG